MPVSFWPSLVILAKGTTVKVLSSWGNPVLFKLLSYVNCPKQKPLSVFHPNWLKTSIFIDFLSPIPLCSVLNIISKSFPLKPFLLSEGKCLQDSLNKIGERAYLPKICLKLFKPGPINW